MHAAKTQLSQLVHRAAAGETILIAKSGRPLARLVPLDGEVMNSRLGFLAGKARIPDDFDELGAEEIAADFDGR